VAGINNTVGYSMVIERGVTSAELLASLSIVLSTLLEASLSFSPLEDLSLLMTADTDSIFEQWLVVFMHS